MPRVPCESCAALSRRYDHADWIRQDHTREHVDCEPRLPLCLDDI